MQTGRPHSFRTRFLIGGIIAVFAMLAGTWSAMQLRERASHVDELAATRFPVARDISAFELVDHHGNPFTNAALQGVWSFLFFGYTHCPDVCPTTLSVLNSVAQQLGDDARDVRFVFISVDPERDTPELLARFVSYFNGDFIGVTGKPESIEPLSRQLGVLYMRVASGDNPGSYLMDHTAGVFLVDPRGKYHAVFMPPLAAGKIVADFEAIRQDYQ
ncbi:MAG TPA: SCO family protein [Gammaproteobacteria bacterium]|nr:SCO family protein [Gammaproteobacteria bacterium]